MSINRPTDVTAEEFDILFYVFAYSVRKEWNCESVYFTDKKLNKITLSQCKGMLSNPIPFLISDSTDECWHTTDKILSIDEVTTYELTEKRAVVRNIKKQKKRVGTINKYEFKIGLLDLKQTNTSMYSTGCSSFPYVFY